MVSKQRPIEPDLYAMDVEESKFAQLEGTGLEYATIGDGDDYAVRDVEHPGDIRRPGDDWRKLGTIL